MSKKIKQENIECKNLEKKAKYASVKMKKGITLIALVVTIVVLLILASVSITVVFGDNGILQLAKEAGEKTNEAVKNDISSIGELEDILHETQTGIKVDKVTDTKPGELEVDDSDGNLFTINSIEDLVVFADNVTSGNTYENKTVKLGLSLDFASTKSYVDANRTDYGKYGYDGELKKLLNESGFIPIGTQEKLDDEEISKISFHGTFDGDGNIIYNFKIREKGISNSKTFLGTGMFVRNYGIIQDLGVENANIYVNIGSDGWQCIGILAGSMTGEINRCHVSGKIVGVAENCDIGGIVGAEIGGVYNSYSDVDITINEKNGYVQVGLIAGTCNTNGTIKNVYSRGNIYPSDNALTGLVAAGNAGKIENSYTIGSIKANESYKTSNGLRTFGGGSEGSKVSYCYYLENTIEPLYNENVSLIFATGGLKAEKEMKSENFVNLLNEGQEENPWKQDTNNINNGYPILSWQQ